jgi:isopenicillin-N N-acyltransferase-like protein
VTVRVLVLDGAPVDRGRVHGEELRTDIADAMERWRAALARDVGDPDAYLDRFLAATDHPAAIGRYAPSLVEEIRGLAEGAAIPLADCLAYQLMDEEWRYRTTSLVPTARCSGIGVFDETPGEALLAQNMDLPSHYDGSQVLLRVRDGDKEAMVFSAAGMLGLDGLNSDAVGICCNTLAQLRTNGSGLPVTFTVREVLARPTLSEATAFVRAVPHAVGQNYLVGSPERVVSLECSAGGVREYAPHPTRVLHTNHPLENDDIVSEPGGEIGALSETERRFEFLERRVFADAPVTVADVQTLLSDRTTPVCKIPTPDKPSITLGCLIMELSSEPVLHLAPGPPSETAFEQFRFAPPA